MTKSNPPPSLRSSSRRLAQKNKVSVTKAPKKQLVLPRKTKKNVINFLDFKKKSGKTIYLVERDGTGLDAWETEDMIESLDVLTSYQQRVQTESGYSINQDSEDQPQLSKRSRPSRASKTRAVIALKQPDYVKDGYVSDDNEIKQKSVRTNSGTKKPANKKSGGRKTKAEVLADIQRAERLNRQKLRSELNPEEIIQGVNHFYGKNCCLQCAANTYRDKLESNDLNGLKADLKDKDIPIYSYEDKPNGLSFIQYAIVLQREKFAETLEEHNKTANMALYPVVPSKYTVYEGGNTGRNRGLGEYQNRQFRRVEEARGNRVGNSAFYKAADSKRTFMNVEDQIRSSMLRSFMPYISKDAFRDENVIANYLVHFSNGSHDVYYAASSGSRLLAKSLLEHVNLTGRSTFNLLHEEVLKFENAQSLTSYRKTQILKMASDAYNVTPYHLSAINPSSTYLSELYEALDPAERLQTDLYGRSVAFYAAVSETSACLEFLESKAFNLSLVDKYKMSPLMQAARFGRSHNVEILIKHLRGGPEVTETSPFVFQTLVRNRRTALHYAAFFGHTETCRVLIKHNAPVECIENLDKQTPLLYAAKNGNTDCVRVLIEEGKANPEKGDKFSRTALHYACMNGHTEVVKYLLSQGVDSNAYDSSHNAPIHFAAAFGYIKIVHLLIEYGSTDPSACNVWRSTPCSVANMKGHIGIVKYLLELPHTSIDVNFKDQDGCIMLQNCLNESVVTPLEKKTNIEKVTLLLAMKADINSINLEGDTSLHTLVSSTDFAKLQPKGWETFYTVPSSYHTYEVINYDEIEGVEYQKVIAKLLIEHGADLDIKNFRNETPLATAMRLGNHHLVTLLIEAGAKFWVDTDEKGNNFFHYFGNFISFVNSLQPHYDLDIMIKERFVDIAKEMWAAIISHSTSHIAEVRKIINVRNNEGYTPLIYSVKSVVQKQREAITREKKMILSVVYNNSANNLGTFGSYNSYRPNDNKGYPSKMFEKTSLPLSVNLTFNFDLWISFMREMVTLFKPNMSEYVTLPAKFKKDKPDAKKTDYPALTGYTALHIAAQTQCTTLINFLLENGSKPNVRVKLSNEVLSGDTPMTLAYHHKKDLYQEVPNKSLECTEVVKKKFVLTKPDFKDTLYKTVKSFIRFKACPYITNSSGTSVLLKASASMDSRNLAQICNVKPSKDGNVNTKNDKEETSLMMAVNSLESVIKLKEEKPNIGIIKHLLKANADPNVLYENGDTVLMKIIRTTDITLLETLLENTVIAINHNIKNKDQENALIVACRLKESKIALIYLSYLKRSPSLCEINTFNYEKHSALSYACKNAELQVVEELLSLNANPNFTMPQHVPLIEAVLGQNIDIINLLLKQGASVNEKNEPYGNTALHTAIIDGKHRIVKLLLENGADFNIPNTRLQSPMHLAVQTTKSQTNRSFRVERLLMKYGADINALDFFGRTPLHYVFVESNLIPITRNTSIISKKVNQIAKEIKAEKDRLRTLNSFSAKFDLGDFSEENIYLNNWMKEAKKIQLDKSELEEQKDNMKHKKQNEEKVLILDEERDLLKVYCDYNWEHSTTVRFDPIDILKYLSDSEDLHYDIRDEFGRTPLHYAACVGAFSCTSLLVEKNVDINAIDSDKNGPVQLALRNNHVDYSVMLCNFGAIVNSDIILKDGESTSTFGFSLSKSLINVAYLIMDKGAIPIESIRESLKNGKFHMAEILLHSIDDESLSVILSTVNQNIWHILSDFKPFNNEVWEEYVQEFIEKLLPLNLSIFQDSYGRTPVHYAAKHGQTVLLRRLLSMPNIMINIIDKDGYSELDYAVKSGIFESVKELLNARASVTSIIKNQKPSLVLTSVQANHYEMTELLLKHGASTDEDSRYGRINAVMVACDNKNLEMLNLLISHNADLNTPSHVERREDFGNKYTVLLHPIFAASYFNSTLLEVMLKAGANPNVYGPDSKPEYSRSCFMYNASIETPKNQQILLEYNVDLNAKDPKTTRTIFYQFFFGKMKYGHGFKDKSNIEYESLKFDDVIFEKMIQNFKPDVNSIDEVTGMTPLELAIREKNMIIVERLLSLGANINMESCNKVNNLLSSSALNPSCQKLPAVIHAVIQNNLNLLQFIFEHALDEMNWIWQDKEKRNILSFIAGSIGGISHENISILEFVAKKMKPKIFKRLLQMRDIHGLTPTEYAYQRYNKDLYDAIVRLEPTAKITQPAQKPQEKEEGCPMDIDYISTEVIDEDARIEREILQKEKDIEKAKDKTLSTKTDDGTVKVDSYSKLGKVGYVMLDENNKPYDIMLIKVELRGWGVYTDTSFYKMSIIHNKVLNLNILWTRWGSYGDEGQHQKTPFLHLEEAIAEFKSIFKAKTANAWEEHLTSFVQKQGRYGLLKVSQHPRDVIVKDFDFLKSSISAQLPQPVTNVMKLICNHTYLTRVYDDSHVDMPLGQVSQSTIESARQILFDVQKMNSQLKECRKQYSNKLKVMESRTWEFKIAQKCVEYARLLPRNDDRNQPFRNLLENYNNNFNNELSRMEDLSYVGFAANVILAAKHHANTTNPLQYAYHALNCSLRSIEPESTEYQLIHNYMQSTATGTYELVNLLAVNRAGEEQRFRQFEKETNRKLLWHGSRIGNFMGILKQGLRVSPRTSTSNGAMLGNGVYFGDTFAKSLNYSTENYGTYQSAYRLLFVCEVALGSKTAIYDQSNYEFSTDNLDSMKGEGSSTPDPDNAVYDRNGVCIPMGPCISFTRTVETDGQINSTPLLNHNEFAVYDQNRIKIRYLLIIRDSTSCFLCSKPEEKNLKPLQEHSLKSYNYVRFNEFEREVIESYMTHQNLSPQNIFDQDLNEFIESGAYKKKWDTPLDLCRDNKVCRKCANSIVAIMLEKRITSKEADIPEFLQSKPQCMYGKECRTQSTMRHIKKYQHWLKEDVSGEYKFSIKKVGLSESDMETEEEAEDTGDETEEDEEEANDSDNHSVNDSDDYMETDEE